MNNIVDFMKIECDSSKLIFNCVGDKEGEIILSDDDNMEIINLNSDIVKGVYEIKNITLFNKLLTITSDFSICMKNNFALTSIYSFDEFGSFTTVLSPVNEDYINNVSYDYSDDEDDIDLIQSNQNILDFY